MKCGITFTKAGLKTVYWRCNFVPKVPALTVIISEVLVAECCSVVSIAEAKFWRPEM